MCCFLFPSMARDEDGVDLLPALLPMVHIVSPAPLCPHLLGPPGMEQLAIKLFHQKKCEVLPLNAGLFGGTLKFVHYLSSHWTPVHQTYDCFFPIDQETSENSHYFEDLIWHVFPLVVFSIVPKKSVFAVLHSILSIKLRIYWKTMESKLWSHPGLRFQKWEIAFTIREAFIKSRARQWPSG